MISAFFLSCVILYFLSGAILFKCINTRHETQERMVRTVKKAAGQMPGGFFQA
ncbi:hypothetical protein EBA29_02686 [Bacillus velezensis]|nr:hypothetical protein O205_07175 [Bacillus amyloliquefaciens EGD-AQ14]QAR57710.1 hypothetical protein EBA29_02686 [Bacillus velezensis]RUS07830.1 hypothetical protein EFW58_00576 [Bacillus velezensis]